MIPRLLADKITTWSRQYPVVTVTGPRQSGKSTLCKALFPDKPYISLEDGHLRSHAKEDPRGFLARFPDGAVLDEIQRAGELCSYIQTIVDEFDRPGLFILTGSRQFELMASVSQSLAGRTAIARLLPFSYAEIYGSCQKSEVPALDQLLYTGFYPRIHDKNLNPTEAYSFYVSTYIERDVRQLLNVKDLTRFETFLKLLAGRSGQLLNVHSLAGDCGISTATAGSWISVLEQSNLVYLLKPYFANIGKRLIKSPKLYFVDTGVLCNLLGVFSPDQLAVHPLRGNVFETYAMMEALKTRYNQGKPDNLTFYRDSKGLEVDALIEKGATIDAWEIKASATFHLDQLRSLETLSRALPLPVAKGLVLGNADEPYRFKDAAIVGYDRFAEFAG